MTTAHATTAENNLHANDGHHGASKPIVKKLSAPQPEHVRKLTLLPPGAVGEVTSLFRSLRRQWLLSTFIFSLLIGGVSVLLYLDFQHNKAIAQQMSAYRSCVNTLLAMHVDSKALPGLGINTHRFYELNDLHAMNAELKQCSATLATLQQAAPAEGWTRWSMRTHLNQLTSRAS